MPVITIAMHPVSSETKQSLIETLTRTASEVAGIPEAAVIVFIQELAEEAIGCGGRTLKELRATQPS